MSLKVIGAAGTVLENRKHFSKELKKKNKKIKKGDDPIFARSGILTVAPWQDTKRVNVMSIIHSSNVIEKIVRSRKEVDGYRIVKKPASAGYYDKFMSVVDTFDQLAANYAYPYCSLKWYVPLFHALIEIALFNGHILYKIANPGTKMRPKKSREHVTLGLIEPQAARKALKSFPSHVGE